MYRFPQEINRLIHSLIIVFLILLCSFFVVPAKIASAAVIHDSVTGLPVTTANSVFFIFQSNLNGFLGSIHSFALKWQYISGSVSTPTSTDITVRNHNTNAVVCVLSDWNFAAQGVITDTDSDSPNLDDFTDPIYINFVPGACALTNGEYYNVQFEANSGGSWVQGGHDNNSRFIADSAAYTPPVEDTTTRIDTVDPADGTSVATSSLPYDFEVTGYVNEDDFADGARVMIKLDRNTDQQATGALSAWDSAFGNKTYLDIDSSGEFDVATSSDNLNLDFPLRVGLYRARWEVQIPRFNVFGFGIFYSTYVATSTRFTVATTTAIDNIQLDQEEYLEEIVDSLGDPLASCQFSVFDTALDFSLGGQVLQCMGGVLHWLFVPPEGTLENTVTQLKDGFLTRPPWGYFTRIVTAVTGGVEGTLPTLTADIPIGPSDEITIEFDTDDIVDGAATLQDSFEAPNGNSLRDIAEPIIQTIVGLLVLLFIYNDIVRSVRL
jgi:hypothetical protein